MAVLSAANIDKFYYACTLLFGFWYWRRLTNLLFISSSRVLQEFALIHFLAHHSNKKFDVVHSLQICESIKSFTNESNANAYLENRMHTHIQLRIRNESNAAFTALHYCCSRCQSIKWYYIVFYRISIHRFSKIKHNNDVCLSLFRFVFFFTRNLCFVHSFNYFDSLDAVLKCAIHNLPEGKVTDTVRFDECSFGVCSFKWKSTMQTAYKYDYSKCFRKTNKKKKWNSALKV